MQAAGKHRMEDVPGAARTAAHLVQGGPERPQLTLCSDISDHDEQKVLPQVSVPPLPRLRPRAALRRVLSRRRASCGALAQDLSPWQRREAARAPASVSMENSVGALGQPRPLREKCARFLVAAEVVHWLLPVRAEHWRRRGGAQAATAPQLCGVKRWAWGGGYRGGGLAFSPPSSLVFQREQIVGLE